MSAKITANEKENREQIHSDQNWKIKPMKELSKRGQDDPMAKGVKYVPYWMRILIKTTQITHI